MSGRPLGRDFQLLIRADDRERIARALYEMFEMRTSRAWDQVGECGAYPQMHHEWIDAADELLDRLLAL